MSRSLPGLLSQYLTLSCREAICLDAKLQAARPESWHLDYGSKLRAEALHAAFKGLQRSYVPLDGALEAPKIASRLGGQVESLHACAKTSRSIDSIDAGEVAWWIEVCSP
jgi:hypothetical protein